MLQSDKSSIKFLISCKFTKRGWECHSKFLTTRGRYSKLFDLKQSNYKAWARGLRAAGYATDRKYPSKLIKIIEAYELYNYDALVLNEKVKKGKTKPQIKEAVIVVNSNKFVVVNKGDTLYSIARNNSVTVDQLKKVNNLISNEIDIGQKLYLAK